MTKELEVQILVDGQALQGTSFITVENGKVDYSGAEEHFYEIMRKWERSWIEEEIADERYEILHNLTPEQNKILEAEHAKNYSGQDDDMEADYEVWLENIDNDELKIILKL